MKTSTTSAALCVSELLAGIIEHLDTTTFASAKLVSWRWHLITQHLIATNINVRKKLFLVPATIDEVLALGIATSNSRFITHDNIGPDENVCLRDERAVAILNPLIFDGVDHNTDRSIIACSRLLRMTSRGKAVYLSQPPPITVRWSIYLGLKLDETRVNFHSDGMLLSQGDHLNVSWKGRRRSRLEVPCVIAETLEEVEDLVMQENGFAVDWSDTQLKLGDRVIPRDPFVQRAENGVGVIAPRSSEHTAWLSRGVSD